MAYYGDTIKRDKDSMEKTSEVLEELLDDPSTEADKVILHMVAQVAGRQCVSSYETSRPVYQPRQYRMMTG